MADLRTTDGTPPMTAESFRQRVTDLPPESVHHFDCPAVDLDHDMLRMGNCECGVPDLIREALTLLAEKDAEIVRIASNLDVFTGTTRTYSEWLVERTTERDEARAALADARARIEAEWEVGYREALRRVGGFAQFSDNPLTITRAAACVEQLVHDRSDTAALTSDTEPGGPADLQEKDGATT